MPGEFVISLPLFPVDHAPPASLPLRRYELRLPAADVNKWPLWVESGGSIAALRTTGIGAQPSRRRPYYQTTERCPIPTLAGMVSTPASGRDPVNGLSSCSCQKMVVASRAIAAFGVMVADDRNVARTALARPVAGHRASPRRSPPVPENSRLRGINSRFDRKNFPVRRRREFPRNQLLKNIYFFPHPRFRAESNEFRVIFPVIPVLREFRWAGAGQGQALSGERRGVRRQRGRCLRSRRPSRRHRGRADAP
jgi:hypothetical protein